MNRSTPRRKPNGATPRGKTKPARIKPQTPTKKRLNQLLASAGFGSRRQCEELILAGRVEIDGQTIEQLGVAADPAKQDVRVDGVSLKPQKLVYYAVHKPIGVVSTNSDPQGRPRVVDLVPPTQRVYPVGRLDRNSDGLMLLTNDGDLAQKLAHPKFGIQKIYRVTVAGHVKPETMKKMREGIYIAEGRVRVDGARILKARSKATEMEIRLREGKNREIRRILAKFGHKVQRLRRIAIGPLRLGDTPAGAYRALTREEVEKLHSIAEQATKTPVVKTSKSKRSKQSKAGTHGNNRHRAGAKAGGHVKPTKKFKKSVGRPTKAFKKRTKTTSAKLGSVIGGDPGRKKS